MPSNYTGNATATQPPSPAPSLSADPIGAMPNDGETLNVSSVLQALKVPLDWIAFLRSKLSPFLGIVTWDAGVAYAAGQVVHYPPDDLTYAVKSGHSPPAGSVPMTDTTNWERWGHSTSDIQAMLPIVAGASDATGVTASAGATITDIIRSSVGMSLVVREVCGTVRIPISGGGGGTTISLSGVAAMPSKIVSRIACNSDSSALPTATVVCASGAGVNAANILVVGAGSVSTIDVSFRLVGY